MQLSLAVLPGLLHSFVPDSVGLQLQLLQPGLQLLLSDAPPAGEELLGLAAGVGSLPEAPSPGLFQPLGPGLLRLTGSK